MRLDAALYRIKFMCYFVPGCDPCRRDTHILEQCMRTDYLSDTAYLHINTTGLLIGTVRDDNLLGTDGADSMRGLAGSDTITGRFGNDTIDAGTGDDLVRGGLGHDSLIGGKGNDILYGDSGNDTLSGGDGDDELWGGPGNGLLFGGNGNDFIVGGYDKDTLNGGAGDDQLFGDDGVPGTSNGLSSDADVLRGGEGDDYLYGGLGDDTLYGGNGSDVLVGATGDDVLVGGLGADHFFFGSAEPDYEPQGMNTGIDTIVGFGDDDIIDVRFANWKESRGLRERDLDSNGDGLVSDADDLVAFLAGNLELDLGSGIVIVERVDVLSVDNFLFA